MTEIVCIMGPTCTGKSEVGIAVASRFGGEIISADSMQVYQGFDIGTAKLPPSERGGIPHHLIDCCDPHETFSAGRFQIRAEKLIDEISGRGRLPVVVGGTGLYFRALLYGLAPVGRADHDVREGLRQRAGRRGIASMYRLLEKLDPRAAENITPGDTQRILRMLEYRILTGKKISEAISRQPFAEERFRTVKIGLTLPRGELRKRIDQRVDRMIEAGIVGEVAGLLDSGADPDAQPFAAIGYRQMLRAINKEVPLDKAIEEIKKATRKYAKRQETWFRRERGVAWISTESLQTAKLKVINLIKGLRNERRIVRKEF